ncbi:MAG: hypothetical protein HYR63_00910 [Proteobacteria bacterium]|nr:hypothetical protein [Pseudomonadota bacterium]
MSLAGKGVIAIWNGITDEGRATFYAWHGGEHIPERVGIPGFRRGRRYQALRGTPEYFTLYETESPETLAGADYLARLNDPTPWTREAIKGFRETSRSLCRVVATHGKAEGGLIATWRYNVAAGRETEQRELLAGRLLPQLAGRPGVAGAHLCVADMAASAIETAEKRAAPDRAVPGWVVLAEGWADAEPFHALCRDVVSDAALTGAGAVDPTYSLYRLQISLDAPR